MKKITLSLLAVFAAFGSGFGQLNYALQAPLDDGGQSAFRGPNGTAAYAFQRSVMFIHEWELLPMNLADITDVSFVYDAGTGGVSVAGSFTLWLGNTADQDMNQPNNFSTIVGGMSQVYTGNFTVPGAAGSSTVPLTLNTPFPYNGGGLYVAWSYTTANPAATNPATLASNAANTGLIYYNNSGTAPVNTFTSGAIFRPALLFNATNTGTNEIEVVRVEALGKVSKLENANQSISVTLVNSSIGPQSNITVSVAATGANAFNTTSVVPSIAPGAMATVVFNNYPTPNSGNSTIVGAAVVLDQDLANNVKSTTQSVGCNTVAVPQPTVPVLDYTQYTVGNGLITAFAHLSGAAPSSITAVSVVIPSFTNAANLGKTVFPVVTTAAGVIVASGNPLTIAAGNMDVMQSLPFTSPVALTPNTPYLFGVGVSATGYFPIGAIGSLFIPGHNVTGYYQMPLGGGTPNNVTYGHLSLEATLAFASTEVQASASKTVVCKKDGPNTVTLTATGLDTYTWTPGNLNGASVPVSPTVASTSGGVVVYNVVGTSTASGCKSTNASITVSVSVCTAIASNTSNGFDLKLFPNPAVNGKSTITGLVGTNAITVFNALGQVVLTQVVSEDTTTLDLSSQPAGNYLVKITDSINESRTIKVMNQ